MSLTLGEKLRQAREERGISISEVAEQTRISPLYIESIENDNYKPLPGGIFNKGFVKSYAKYVGIDENEALREYARVAASAELEQAEPPRSYRPEVLTDDRPGLSMLTIFFACVILAFMVAGILFLVWYTQSPETPRAVTNVQTNATSGAVLTTPGTPQQPPTGAPLIDASKIEFRAAGQPVWLRAVIDGKSSETLIDADKSVVFEPKESLKLSYSRSRVQFAKMSINGKDVSLPTEPAGPNKGTIEVEVNRSNFAEIWQSGKTSAGAASAREVGPTNRGFVPPRPKPSPTPGATHPSPPATASKSPAGAAARPTPR